VAADNAFKRRFGRRLKRLRQQAGLSQNELARLTPGADNSQVSRWERGHTLPGFANQQALARALDIQHERLFYDPGDE
jgi:transcriptional regulator with XRE-family HTH domain